MRTQLFRSRVLVRSYGWQRSNVTYPCGALRHCTQCDGLPCARDSFAPHTYYKIVSNVTQLVRAARAGWHAEGGRGHAGGLRPPGPRLRHAAWRRAGGGVRMTGGLLDKCLGAFALCARAQILVSLRVLVFICIYITYAIILLKAPTWWRHCCHACRVTRAGY